MLKCRSFTAENPFASVHEPYRNNNKKSAAALAFVVTSGSFKIIVVVDSLFSFALL